MTEPTAQDPRITALLQEIANNAAQHAVESFQLRYRATELESENAQLRAQSADQQDGGTQ